MGTIFFRLPPDAITLERGDILKTLKGEAKVTPEEPTFYTEEEQKALFLSGGETK